MNNTAERLCCSYKDINSERRKKMEHSRLKKFMTTMLIVVTSVTLVNMNVLADVSDTGGNTDLGGGGTASGGGTTGQFFET